MEKKTKKTPAKLPKSKKHERSRTKVPHRGRRFHGRCAPSSLLSPLRKPTKTNPTSLLTPDLLVPRFLPLGFLPSSFPSFPAVSTFAETGKYTATTTSLLHPRLSERLTYLLCPSSSAVPACGEGTEGEATGASPPPTPQTLLEVTSLAPSKYSSFFSNSTVLSNGHFHSASPVDPLLLSLPLLPPLLQKFCPFDQFGTSLDDGVLEGVLTEERLERVCEVSDVMGDDMLLYKFSEAKCLAYLVAKVVRVREVLERREEEARRVEREGVENATFNLGEERREGGEEGEKEEERRREKAKEVERGAVLMVAEYLNEEWKGKLCKALSLTLAVLEPVKAERKRKAAWDRGRDAEQDKLLEYTLGSKEQVLRGEEAKRKEEKNKAQTPAQKKQQTQAETVKKSLVKASKGMKSLASFDIGSMRCVLLVRTHL